MKTKSLIQEKVEEINNKENFIEGVSSLMEKYNIEDSIFTYSNNHVSEALKGYFTINGEYNSIREAINNCDLNTMGIRIMENTKFQVGTIYNNLSNCPEGSKILDIDILENVR